jgi:hypothetical protein
MMEPTTPTPRRRRARPVVDDDAGWDAALTPEQRLEALVSRVEALEGEPSLRERGRSMVSRVMPPEASTHFRNAGREQLLGIRSIVDFWIDKLDQAESNSDRSRSRTRETIEIE